jgi:ATP/ADP translocase
MVLKDRREFPGFVLLVVSVLVLVGCLTTAAMIDAGWTIGLGVAALVVGVSGVVWIFVGRSRVTPASDHRGPR